MIKITALTESNSPLEGLRNIESKRDPKPTGSVSNSDNVSPVDTKIAELTEGDSK